MARASQTPREISAGELAVLERALTVAAVDSRAAELAASARFLEVVGRCECGCASVDFRHRNTNAVPYIVADAICLSPEGEDLGLIVWGVDGAVSGLEVYSYSDRPAPLPVLSSIQPSDGNVVLMPTDA